MNYVIDPIYNQSKYKDLSDLNNEKDKESENKPPEWNEE